MEVHEMLCGLAHYLACTSPPASSEAAHGPSNATLGKLKGIYKDGEGFKGVHSGVAPANQTKERSVRELFCRGIPEQKFNVNRACFPKEKHQNSQKWAKFMNFSFWPFLWFGLPGRLLIHVAFRENSRSQEY